MKMSTSENIAAITERKIENDRVHVTFPVVNGLNDLQIQNKVNEKIRDSIYKMIWNEGFEKEPQSLVEGSYQIALNNGSVISMVLNLTFCLPDNSDLQNKVKSYTFDLRTGELYKFEDLFKRDSGYVERINKMIKQQIIERNIPLLKKFKSIEKDEKFYLTPEAVVVYYPVNEYTPAEFGVLEFAVNIGEVRDIVYSKGPLKS
jgi:hypothetical protein